MSSSPPRRREHDGIRSFQWLHFSQRGPQVQVSASGTARDVAIRHRVVVIMMMGSNRLGVRQVGKLQFD